MAAVIDLDYQMGEVNVALLHEELRAALGEDFVGLSYGAGMRLRVHVRDSLPAEQRERIRAVLDAHDATKLTAAQQAALARQQAAATLAKPWPEWTAADKDAYLRLLAEQGIGLAG